ncbi:MAG TPA: hypothetical protein VJ476_05095 [Rhizomicrobium sp.]|nr:hypothetical protein [Rhizomicrobium sp.]
MTNINTYVPAQTSAFSGAVANLFSAAVLVMAGVLAFSVFVNV